MKSTLNVLFGLALAVLLSGLISGPIQADDSRPDYKKPLTNRVEAIRNIINEVNLAGRGMERNVFQGHSPCYEKGDHDYRGRQELKERGYPSLLIALESEFGPNYRIFKDFRGDRSEFYKMVIASSNIEINKAKSELWSRLAPQIVYHLDQQDVVQITDLFRAHTEIKSVKVEKPFYEWQKVEDTFITIIFDVNFSLSAKGNEYLSKSIYFQPSTDVGYTVFTLEKAIKQLKINKKQRRILKGFRDVVVAYADLLRAESAKEEADRTPISDVMFLDMARTIVAHYDFITPQLREFEELSSEAESDQDKINQGKVAIIDLTIKSVKKIYGLQRGKVQSDAAMYGLVLIDLIQNQLDATQAEKEAYIYPFLKVIGKIVPISRGSGDVGAIDEITDLKALWETKIQGFFRARLSATSESGNATIMMIAGAVRKIGRTVNIDIDIFQKDAVR